MAKNEDWITMNGTHILVDKDNKEASIEKFLNKHGKTVSKNIMQEAKDKALSFNDKIKSLEPIENNPKWAYQPDGKTDLKDMVKNPIPFVGDGNDWKIGEQIENAIQPDYKSNVPIDISTLKTLQPFVLKSGLENYKRFDVTERPYIVNYEGQNYVIDGNHRIAIAKLKGDKTINVDVSFRKAK